MTITYEYEGALYVNLTNKCNCNCEFCLRHGKAQGSIYTEDSLWLEREPTRQEALDSFLSRDIPAYREIVFCGFGEPTERLDALLQTAAYVKQNGGRVRINTNGHASLIAAYDVTPRIEGLVDVLSISLNASNAQEYQRQCNCRYGEQGFDAMLDFAVKAKRYVPQVIFSIMDVLPPQEQAACKKLCADLGVPLRIRSMIK